MMILKSLVPQIYTHWLIKFSLTPQYNRKGKTISYVQTSGLFNIPSHYCCSQA